MKQLNCETFQFSIKFSESQFKAKEFRESIKCKDKKQDYFVFHYNSKLKTRKEHAHLEIILDEDDSLLQLSFHTKELSDENSEIEVSDGSSEEALSSLSEFFQKTIFKTRIMIVFSYDKSFESLLKIQYPLLIKNEILRNAIVSGHEISFSDSKIHTAFISASKRGLNVLTAGRIEIDLASFNYHSIIKQFAEYSEALVKKKD